MIDYIGVDYLLGGLFVAVVIISIQLDRFSRHALKHIDQLQLRVDELERRLGINEN